MKVQIMTLMIILSLLFFNCEDQFTIAEVDYRLNILYLDSLVPLYSGQNRLMQVQVEPFRLEDIDRLQLKAVFSEGEKVLAEWLLLDDGREEHGDAVIYDGVYSTFWNDSILTNEGEIQIRFSLLENGTEKASIDTMFSVRAVAAYEMVMTVVPDTIEESAGMFQFRKVSEDTSWQEYQITVEFYPDESFSGEAAGKEIFSGVQGGGRLTLNYDTSFAAGLKGNYYLRFIFRDSYGQSSFLTIPTAVHILNSLPEILQIYLPDSLKLPSSGTVPFEIMVYTFDQRGPADIRQVTFRVKKPDGNYSNNGDEFFLSDDGNAPDQVKNDGIYSGRFVVSSENAPGDYWFVFIVQDKVLQSSEMVAKKLTLY